MKVLTIRQPWASLIVDGYKGYEIRSRKTNYRGKILIHAGLKIENDMIDKFRNYNLNYFRGAIIGEAELVDCIFIDNEFNKKLQKINSLVYEKDYVGNYAWKLDKVIKYDKPIYCKGQLGLWNYNIK